MITSAEEFVRLRTSDEPELYMRAGRDSAPDEVWLEVIEKYPDMRIWVARNYRVPLGILRILSRDLDVLVRHAVAKKKLPDDMFVELARDPEDLVKQSLIDNRHTPERILQLLSNDESEWIANKAKRRLENIRTKS